MTDIDVGAVRRALSALGFETTDVYNPTPICRCVAQWKTPEGQMVALKITWPQGSPLATPENIAGLLKYFAYNAAPLDPPLRWVPPEATLFLCEPLLEETIWKKRP